MNQYAKYRMTQQQEKYDDDLFDEEPVALDQEDLETEGDWDGQAEDIEALASQSIQLKNSETGLDETEIDYQNPYLSEMKSKPASNHENNKTIQHYYQEPEEES